MGYFDPAGPNEVAYLSQIPAAPPGRMLPLTNITNGLNLAPGLVGNNIGSAQQDIPRNHMPYVGMLMTISGIVSTSSSGAGVAGSAFRQYQILDQIAMQLNGGNQWIALRGRNLYSINLWQAQSRNSEVLGADVLLVAPTTGGGPKNFSLSYWLPFVDVTIAPRLFNIANFYQNSGITQVTLLVRFGDVSNLVISGDANANLHNVNVTLSAQQLDYTLVPALGEPYVRQTRFALQMLNVFGSIPIVAGNNQQKDMTRGKYHRSWIWYELAADGKTLQPGTIQNFSVVRNNNDFFWNGFSTADNDRIVSDRYGFNAFEVGQQGIHIVDFCPFKEVSQMMNSYNMTAWQFWYSANTTGILEIVEVTQDIPAMPTQTTAEYVASKKGK